MNKNTYWISSLIVIFSFGIAFSLLSYENFSQTVKNEVIPQKDSSVIVTVKSFWQKCENGDLKKAKQYRTDKAGELVIFATNSPTWEQVIFDSKMKHRSFEIEKINEKEAVVKAEIENHSGETMYLFHNLLKENDEWKIFTITF